MNHSVFPTCVPFLYTLFLENEKQPSKKKLQSNVSQVKQSPHAKIQLVLSTFKNGQKIQGTFLHMAFHLVNLAAFSSTSVSFKFMSLALLITNKYSCYFSAPVLFQWQCYKSTVHWGQPWFVFLLNCSHNSYMQEKTVSTMVSLCLSLSVPNKQEAWWPNA